MTRVALYARYSSDLQRPKSIEDQLADCRAYAARQGWTVAQVFTDYEMSAATLSRPGLQALLEAARDRRFDVVLIEDLDRISRDLGDTANLRRDLLFNDVKLHTLVDREIDLIHVAFKGVKNAQMIEDLGHKLRRSQRGTAAKGLAAGGLSYGYDPVRELDERGEVSRGRRRINEAEAAVIRRIFADYVAGVSVYEITRRLNVEGVPAPGAGTNKGDGKWRVTTIVGNRARANGILHNRLYIGELVYNRCRKLRDPRTGKRINRVNPQSEWQITAVPELRILDDATWSAAQAIKERNGGKALQRQNRRPRHLLSGLVFCSCCSSPFIVRDASRLVCASHRAKGICENARTIKREDLQARVVGKLRAIMSSAEGAAVFIREYHEAMRAMQADAGNVRRRAHKELNDVKGKIARLVAAIEEGGDGKTLAGRIRELEGRQAELERELAAVDVAPVQLHPDAHEMFAAKMADLEKGLVNGTPAEQAGHAADLRGLIDRLVLHPDDTAEGGLRIEIEGRLDGMLRFAAGVTLPAANNALRTKAEWAC